MTRQKPAEIEYPLLDPIPVTFQAIFDFFEEKRERANPTRLRQEVMRRIQQITGRPIICYVTRTRNIPQDADAYIEDGDLTGWDDLISTTEGGTVDVFIVSNGGSAEVAERMVVSLRERFESVRFIVPHNAYSAATLICFSGDVILMGSNSTLGPIDPQIGGIPARAILRGFQEVEERLRDEGPSALTAYMPLLQKYDLPILEICKTAQKLAEELAQEFLHEYMLSDADIATITKCVGAFSNYDEQKSHARGIHRKKARQYGLKIIDIEDTPGLSELVRSLYNQYDLWFDKTPFYKMFENAFGINWGRQARVLRIVQQELQQEPPS